MASEIKSCQCKHPAQDQLHGTGVRVHNQTLKGWRCTVCGKEILSGSNKK